MADIPPKPYLDARDDQLMAALRDARSGLEQAGDTGFLGMGEALAALLREQFPAEPGLGRITLAVAKCLGSVMAATEAERLPPVADGTGRDRRPGRRAA